MKKNNLFAFDKENTINDCFLTGTDEAGRGSGAGPVCAAAVCFKNQNNSLIKDLAKLNDSKKITPKIREELFEILVNQKEVIYSVVFGSVEEIEKYNILQTSLNCMKRACYSVTEQLKSENMLVIIDGNKLIPDFKYPQKCFVKGDGKSASIAAASVIAKVSRDRYMTELGKDFPQYDWAQNKGYLTEEHLKAIDEFGTTIHHRPKYLEKHFAKQLSLF